MAGNVLADFGLGMEGKDTAEAVRQSNETGRIGLESLQRQDQTQADVRNAAISGANAGKDTGATFEDMAIAAEKRGDVNQAYQIRKAKQTIEEEGIKNVIHKALIDPTPGDRPDLVEEANRYGKNRNMKAMHLDENGNLTFEGPRTGTMNVGVVAERMGMVKPFEKEITEGGMYIRGNPATGQTTTISNPKPDQYAATRGGVIFNKKTGAWQQTDQSGEWSLGEIANGDKKVPVSFNKRTGEAVVLGPGGNQEKAQIHTDATGKTFATVGNQVFEVTPGSPGTPEKTHLFSANEPATPPTSPTLTPVSTPPAAGARKAPDGNWYVSDPKRPGKYLQVGGQPAAPAGAPAASVPAAAPAPKPAPAAPTQAPARAARVAEDQSKIERFNRDLAGGGDRQEKVAARQADIGKQLPDRLKRYSRDDQMWISENMHNFSRAQLKQIRDRSEQAAIERFKTAKDGNYADGGKVQRYGL